MFVDKLFLNKENDLFIDGETTRRLLHHQKDGLRFLYEQFEKNAPGVIINDPPGSGRKVEIVLFLNTLHKLLEQPALILSAHVNSYQELFHHWTIGTNAVVCNSKKPPHGTNIYLNEFGDVPALSGTNWSIVVVDDVQYSDKLMRQLKAVRARYKMVIASTDLKKDITTFFRIYQWINPNNKTSANDFMTTKHNCIKERIEKAIMLDRFFEQIVLRRKHIEGIFKSDKFQQSITEEEPRKKKNKDNTGTKIKRTKQKKEDEKSDSFTNNESKRINNKTSRESEKQEEIYTLETNDAENSPPIIKGPKKPKRPRLIESDDDDYDNISVIETTTSVIKASDIKEAQTINHSSDKLKEVTSMDRIEDYAVLERNADTNIDMEILLDTSQNLVNETIIRDINEVSTTCKTGIEVSTICNTGIEVSTTCNTGIEDSTKCNTAIEASTKCNTAIEASTTCKTAISASPTCNIAKQRMCMNDEFNSSQDKSEINEDKLFTNCDKKQSCHNQTNEVENAEIIATTDSKVERDVNKSCNNINASLFDDKLKDLEEKAFKKYKGSIFDSIF